MDPQKELEERLRESVHLGDEDSIRMLLEKGVDVNAKHSINGWTALHWASKRDHANIVSVLLAHGADGSMRDKKGITPVQLTSNPHIRAMLGSDESESVSTPQTKAPITPNYLANPQFPYIQDSKMKKMEEFRSPNNNHVVHNNYNNRPELPYPGADNELVLKVRVANSIETDFIEIELDNRHLTFDNLVNMMCKELDLNKRLVSKIRKLPDTIVRKDKDVKRLKDFQELEVVVASKAVNQSSLNYGPQPREMIVY